MSLYEDIKKEIHNFDLAFVLQAELSYFDTPIDLLRFHIEKDHHGSLNEVVKGIVVVSVCYTGINVKGKYEQVFFVELYLFEYVQLVRLYEGVMEVNIESDVGQDKD